MKKILILIISVSAVSILGYIFVPGLLKSGNKQPVLTSSADVKVIPKVLFITSGVDEGRGKISEGVIVALQTFGRHGNFVRLDNRDVLMQPKVLSEYSIMIMPTSMGYNDGDRKYSLSYLSDYEMENISNWVKEGGTLIAEENIGRNTMDETDRVNDKSELNRDNWKLSDVFGIKMKEIDMNGFSIEEKDAKIWNGTIKEKNVEDEWALVPTEVFSDKVKVIAEWIRGDEKYPAIFSNEFGKGKAYFFSSTYLLHPSNTGGISSIEQIENFYEYVLNSINSFQKIEFEINPWPFAKTSAFCISLNSKGNPEQYKMITDFLNNEKLTATVFIDSSLSQDQKNILEQNGNLTLQSGLFSGTDLSETEYSGVVREILMNEQLYGRKFNGLRFPKGKVNFWGLIYADEKGYAYESSIGADQLMGFEGAVFPYNISVSQNSFYKSLNLLEICPAGKTDEDFFGKSESEKDYFEEDQRKDAQLFGNYLNDFYHYDVQKNNGLMVYSGSPQYTCFSEITMQPLRKLIDSLKAMNCWMTSLDEVTSFRNKLRDLSVEVNVSGNETDLKIILPAETEIKGLTFKFKSKPDKIKSSSNTDLKEINGMYYLSGDFRNGDIISLTF